MGLLSGLMGHASEADVAGAESMLEDVIVEGETINVAFKLVRDMIVVTSKRVIFIDKQGMTGKKVEILSIPFTSITQFSKEGAGHFDMDSELKLWLRGKAEPFKFPFKRGDGINQVYKAISAGLLG